MSIFSIFKRGLVKSMTKLSRSIAGVFTGVSAWDETRYEELEEALISADFGVPASLKIVKTIREQYEQGQIKTDGDIFEVASQKVAEILGKNHRPWHLAPAGAPTVILFVGVNGSGKTTTIGKLAAKLKNDRKKVLLAACDTFRAAASEQLKLWAEKTGVPIIASLPGADPASVAFDATQAALARQVDYLLIDTAGRQHNQKALMDELAKIRRTVKKVYPDAPQETWLIVDASLGSNALSQARGFLASAELTGLVLTKLDGTGKGGMVVALHEEFALPTFLVGLGEQPEDLQAFEPKMFAAALFNRDWK